MALKKLTPATALAASLAEAKANMGVQLDDDDLKITLHIRAATAMAEQKTGRVFMATEFQKRQSSFVGDIELTRVPVLSITSVSYVDLSGAEVTLDPASYVLDDSNDYSSALIFAAYGTAWPVARDVAGMVTVRYVAGYADADQVPPDVKQWICLVVGMLYDNAGILSERQMYELDFAQGLLDAAKVWG